MVTHEDFKTIRLMASLFTPDEEISSKKLLKTLPENWKTRFNGQSAQVMVEGQFLFPPELPKLILQDENGEWKCEIGSKRVNFVWQNATADAQAPSIQEFFRAASTFLNEYADEVQHSRVGRISATIERYAFNENPATCLCEYFCKEDLRSVEKNGPLKRSDNFELHNHKRISFSIEGEEVPVNSWVRSKTGMLPIEQEKLSPMILVVQDINSLGEELEERSFTFEQGNSFFEVASNELDNILSFYYPTAS